jgi:uncharacterized membrane protein
MQVSEQLTSNDRTKFIAILSYMTIVGWLIALVLHGKDKDPLARFHLRQSLGLFVTAMILAFVPLVGWIINLFLIAAWCYGLYSAIIGHKYTLPIIGDFYQRHIDFIA